jgi:aspartyl-tRNA(Asn)/glutamyl-tRNA(Gln) amidotransferase subunit C
MKITNEMVEQLGELAQLRIEDAQVEPMRRDLEELLSYFEQLSEVDTEGVPPTAHVLDLATPLREDRVHDVLSVDQAVGNAPDHDDASMIVPKVIE